MAKTRSPSILSPLSVLFPRNETFILLLSLLSIFSLFINQISASPSSSHFEGFDADDDDFSVNTENDIVPSRITPPPQISLSTGSHPESHHGPPDQSDEIKKPNPTFDSYWDEDEFEGIPVQEIENPVKETVPEPELVNKNDDLELGIDNNSNNDNNKKKFKLGDYVMEIVCVSFLVVFGINYFTGKKENENLALSWASMFGTKGSIFDKNFSLLGVGETDDSPLLLKEGQTVFKFYASGRRFCSGLLATMELKSRHDLISKMYNAVVPCKDEITIEVYMNDEGMDQIVFALARKKLAKGMVKEERDLQRFAGLVGTPNGKKWVAEELQVVAESKEVAGDLITDAVLDQVFGDKAFEKFGKGFISMHFSDQHPGSSKKMLIFKFALPDANNMADMSRLITLVPYYIDVIGRYKLSSNARSKTEATRSKLAQEVYKELQNARQEALQNKKAEQRKKLQEAETKLNAEALRRREAKERARQMKKAMPKLKMSRA